MGFWVYMLRCADGSYYTGHTEDLDVRMAAHRQRRYGGYTASRLPVTLVWREEFPTREESFDSERRIKGWSRAKKEALIRGDSDELQRLAGSEQPARPEHPIGG